MAISASTVFEVRQPTGNDLNSGGFVAGGGGTDFSQQNSPQVTFNGTTITATAAGASATIILTGYTVSAADVGNLHRVAGGVNFTTGLYQILSVNVGGNSWTLDRNVTTGVGSAMTGRMGGALATLSESISDAVAHNTIWNTGTFTLTVTLTLSVNSSGGGTPLSFMGYGSTRGDSGRSTVTSATNGVNLFEFTNGSGYLFQNTAMTSTAGTRGDALHAKGSNASYVRLVNCVISGVNVGINGNFAVDFAFQGLSVENSEIKSCVSHGVFNSGTTSVLGSFIHDNGGAGIKVAGGGVDGSLTVSRTIVYNNAGGGIVDTNNAAPPSRSMVLANVICANNTGAGIQATAAPSLVFLNVILSTNTTGIDTGGSVPPCCAQWNIAFFNNTTQRNGPPAGFSDVTLTASPYTALGTDFSLNATAGGGAACKAAGFPGVLSAGGTGFANIGVLDPSGSGSTTILGFGPNITQFVERER